MKRPRDVQDLRDYRAVRDFGPMTLAKALDELRALYKADDEFSPYAATKSLPDGLVVTCKDGTELRITVAVSPL